MIYRAVGNCQDHIFLEQAYLKHLHVTVISAKYQISLWEFLYHIMSVNSYTSLTYSVLHPNWTAASLFPGHNFQPFCLCFNFFPHQKCFCSHPLWLYPHMDMFKSYLFLKSTPKSCFMSSLILLGIFSTSFHNNIHPPFIGLFAPLLGHLTTVTY